MQVWCWDQKDSDSHRVAKAGSSSELGRVIIGNDVEVGANTTIDRGAIGDTVIGNGVKLDKSNSDCTQRSDW